MRSKPSRCPEKKLLQERKKAWGELRKKQVENGLNPPRKPTLPNRKSQWETTAEEQAARQQVVEEQVKVYRILLPSLLKRLARIPDPRNPKTIKHKLTVVLLYGLLMFILQMSSRREANRQMSMPTLLENLQRIFPELESLPHHDTLNRLLSRIEVEEIQEAHAVLVHELIRNKKFVRYLWRRRYLITIDGTQKFARDIPWTAEALERQRGDQENGRREYYVYVLEGNLVFPGGISIPLHTEFLEYSDGDVAAGKQDCELKAFRRMAAWIKKHFPRLPIMVLLDGLYPNGPIMALCRRYKWQFMIVLQEGSLASVWEEAEGLRRLNEESLEQTWGDRRQRFWWVNNITYEYGPNGRHKQTVHVVVCEEYWEEVSRDTAEIVEKKARHAWISSEPLSQKNVHSRCNLAARYRWAIENHILVEKHYGYQYEHCFSYNWNAMKGYHYLMRLAHLLNTLAHLSVHLAEQVAVMGMRGLLRFFRETLTGPWLDTARIRALLSQTHQLRLV